MNYILTRNDGPSSRDVYITDDTPVFAELRQSGWVEYPTNNTWRRFGNVRLPDSRITVQEWHRCPNDWCVNDAHEGDEHVDATGRSFVA